MVAEEIRAALTNLGRCNLDYDLVDHAPRNSSAVTTVPPSVGGAPCGQSPLVAAIDCLCYALDKSGKKYADMHVRSKHPGSVSAYTIKQPLREYLGELCKIPEYKSVLTNQINQIVNFLKSNPSYGGIKSIKIDLNLIEVTPFPFPFSSTIVTGCHLYV